MSFFVSLSQFRGLSSLSKEESLVLIRHFQLAVYICKIFVEEASAWVNLRLLACVACNGMFLCRLSGRRFYKYSNYLATLPFIFTSLATEEKLNCQLLEAYVFAMSKGKPYIWLFMVMACCYGFLCLSQ